MFTWILRYLFKNYLFSPMLKVLDDVLDVLDDEKGLLPIF